MRRGRECENTRGGFYGVFPLDQKTHQKTSPCGGIGLPGLLNRAGLQGYSLIGRAAVSKTVGIGSIPFALAGYIVPKNAGLAQMVERRKSKKRAQLAAVLQPKSYRKTYVIGSIPIPRTVLDFL